MGRAARRSTDRQIAQADLIDVRLRLDMSEAPVTPAGVARLTKEGERPPPLYAAAALASALHPRSGSN